MSRTAIQFSRTFAGEKTTPSSSANQDRRISDKGLTQKFKRGITLFSDTTNHINQQISKLQKEADRRDQRQIEA